MKQITRPEVPHGDKESRTFLSTLKNQKWLFLIISDFLNSAKFSPRRTQAALLKGQNQRVRVPIRSMMNFFRVCSFAGIQEKFRQAIAKRRSDNRLGRSLRRVHHSHPTAKPIPNLLPKANARVLQHSLGYASKLYEPMIGIHFSHNHLAIPLAFSVQADFSGFASGSENHHLHPEMIGIGADGMHSLFERRLYFESPTVGGNDLNRGQVQVDAQKNGVAFFGVDDQHETVHCAYRPPKQIQAAIPYRRGLAVKRRISLDKLIFLLEQFAQFHLFAINFLAASGFCMLERRGKIGDGVASDSTNQSITYNKGKDSPPPYSNC
jgi:hypothetical protein